MVKRIDKIKTFKKYTEDELFSEYKAIENDTQQQYDNMEAERLMRGEDGEFDETRDLENTGVIKLQKKKISEQDDKI